MSGKSALIFGASGVSGWAFVNEILNDYPQKGVWDRVHALTNRKLAPEYTLWPKDPRLHLVSGVDLLVGTQDDLEAAIRSQISDIDQVTHVYYLAYKANKDVQQELQEAVAMFQRSTMAIDHLSPALEFVVLQTGAKMYGCHLLENHPTDYIHVPLGESQPRLKPPYHDALFYHPQLDWITEYVAQKNWNWIDTRPDIIVGYTPIDNFYSLGTVLGIYFSLYAHVEGQGALCPFPGSSKSWVAKSIDSSSDMIARQTLHLSLTLPVSRKGEGFNVADATYWSTWETRWPALCKYFGLQGTPPPERGGAVEVRRYISTHVDHWRRLEAEKGLRNIFATSDNTFKGFEYFLLTQFDFDRQYDMTKMYSTGFKEERSVQEAWYPVFDRMKAGKIIP